jgi:hypothetical protein
MCATYLSASSSIPLNPAILSKPERLQSSLPSHLLRVFQVRLINMGDWCASDLRQVKDIDPSRNALCDHPVPLPDSMIQRLRSITTDPRKDPVVLAGIRLSFFQPLKIIAVPPNEFALIPDF